uniref:Uncharacterized protein n=1 Tax=Phlebotomus papatasi TaxID=29031 RepID=A0A1B0DRA9_PHLPP
MLNKKKKLECGRDFGRPSRPHNVCEYFEGLSIKPPNTIIILPFIEGFEKVSIHLIFILMRIRFCKGVLVYSVLGSPEKSVDP